MTSRLASYRRTLSLAAMGAAALVHCSSKGSDGAVDASAALQCTSSHSTAPVARPTCETTSAYSDAGPVACATLSDCADAGAVFNGCLAGQCVVDQCVIDSDCPTGQACACDSEFLGDVPHYNQCLPAQCRTNADCADGSTCSPSVGGDCARLSGFYCHSSADECAGDADCKCGYHDVQNGLCVFSPQLGHFACQPPPGCAG